jgi:hypothetical protein
MIGSKGDEERNGRKQKRIGEGRRKHRRMLKQNRMDNIIDGTESEEW